MPDRNETAGGGGSAGGAGGAGVGALGDELARIHEGLRRQVAGLLAEAERFVGGWLVAGRVGDAPPAPGLDAQLRERCLLYCDAVNAHHDNESSRGFPRLERRFPELRPVLERLRREHVALARIQGEVRRTLATLAGAGSAPADPGPAAGSNGADPGTALAGLRRLAAELDAHFDREERQLVAALNSLSP